jgi:hypothetical protein
MLTAAGIEAAFKTVAADPRAPDEFTHVYVVAILPDGILPLDCSHGSAPGWEYPRALKSRIWRRPLMPVIKRRTLSGLGDDLSLDDAAALYGAASSGFDSVYGTTSTPTSAVPFSSSSSSSSSPSTLNLTNVLDTALNAAGSVLKTTLAPTLPPGTYYQTGPNGTTIYTPAAGSSISLPGLSTPISTTTLMLLGLAAFAALFLFNKG